MEEISRIKSYFYQDTFPSSFVGFSIISVFTFLPIRLVKSWELLQMLIAVLSPL